MKLARKHRQRKTSRLHRTRRPNSNLSRIGFEQLEQRLVLDSLSFDLRTDRTDYSVGEKVKWEVWLSLSNVKNDNFGVQTAAFSLTESRSEQMEASTISPAFADYTFRPTPSVGPGWLRNVGAGQIGYNASVVEVTASDPGPTLLASGSYTVFASGVHELSLTPDRASRFYTSTSFRTQSYDSLVGDTATLTVGGSSSPVVNLSVDKSTIPEENGVATVSATLSVATDKEVTVDLGFSGTATRSVDYTPSSTQIVIAAGSRSATMRVAAVQDGLDEPNETVVVAVTGLRNAREAQTDRVTVNIVDDDSPPSDKLSFDLRTDKTDYHVGDTVKWEAWVSLSEVANNNFGVQQVSFDLAENRSELMQVATIGSGFSDYSDTATGAARPGALKNAGAVQLSYDASVVEVTAAQPGPIQLASGSYTVSVPGAHQLSLTPRTTTQFFAVNSGTAGTPYSSLLGDFETFTVGSVPNVRLRVDKPAISEANGVATVSAFVTTIADRDVTVGLGFSGTATNSIDYTASSTKIVIPAGSLSGTTRIATVQDQLVEPTETIVVDINSVSNGHESGTQRLAINIVDDDAVPTGDALHFDLRTNKTEYVVGETIHWEAWLSLSHVKTNNFGIHTVSFDLADDRSERLTEAVVGAGFADYTLNSKGVPHRGSLRNVGAGQLGYDAAVVEVTAASPGPTMLAQGSFVATRTGSHELSITPTSNAFFASGSGFVGTSYSSLIGDSESFVVGGASAPTVRLKAIIDEMLEGGGVSLIEARLSTVLDEDVRVDLGYSGTATNGEDYTSSTHMVIPAGNLRGISQLTAVQDELVEGNETIVVDILDVDFALEAGTQQVSISIVDDDESSQPSDTLQFDLQTDKTNYVNGDTVQWQVFVSLESPSTNFGLTQCRLISRRAGPSR